MMSIVMTIVFACVYLVMGVMLIGLFDVNNMLQCYAVILLWPVKIVIVFVRLIVQVIKRVLEERKNDSGSDED